VDANTFEVGTVEYKVSTPSGMMTRKTAPINNPAPKVAIASNRSGVALNISGRYPAINDPNPIIKDKNISLRVEYTFIWYLFWLILGKGEKINMV
jgi:hypothetical protein